MMFRLDGKVALVTGAASGMGREIALLFAKQGAFVAVADLNVDGAEGVVREIEAEGGRAYAQPLDVTKLESAQAAVAGVVARGGRLDVLVNNAGIGLVGNLLETEPADFDR